MKKALLKGLSLSALILLTACAAPTNSTTSTNQTLASSAISQTTGRVAGEVESLDIPSDYFSPVSNGGRVERVTYESRDYSQDNPQAFQRAVSVYLPAGYDESQNYNVLYLMHGWTGNASTFFNESRLVTLLDNMIEKGDIEPTIVVTPTFDAENRSQNFERSEEQIRVFYQDFENNLMPFIEGNYATYAASTSREDLIASRNHRAFAGFSGGSVTTWSQLIHNLDYIQYFGPMSGDSWEVTIFGGRENPKGTADRIEQAVTTDNTENRDFYIYGFTGTEDFADELISPLVAELRTRDAFTNENLAFATNPGGVHDLVAVEEYIYNMLPNFFEK